MAFDIEKRSFEVLGQEKLADAELLLANQRWTNAYYLSGYAVEFALKACIAKLFRSDVLPDKDTVISAYTHSLGKLAGQAQLKRALETGPRTLQINWSLVNAWTPDSRYRLASEKDATDMFTAVSEKQNGVFQWIKAHW